MTYGMTDFLCWMIYGDGIVILIFVVFVVFVVFVIKKSIQKPVTFQFFSDTNGSKIFIAVFYKSV